MAKPPAEDRDSRPGRLPPRPRSEVFSFVARKRRVSCQTLGPLETQRNEPRWSGFIRRRGVRQAGHCCHRHQHPLVSKAPPLLFTLGLFVRPTGILIPPSLSSLSPSLVCPRRTPGSLPDGEGCSLSLAPLRANQPCRCWACGPNPTGLAVRSQITWPARCFWRWLSGKGHRFLESHLGEERHPPASAGVAGAAQ